MAKKAKVWDGSTWQDLVNATQDLTPYSTTAQMNTAINVGSGLNLITTATVGTAVSGVQINNCFNSTYQNYKLIVSGVVGSSGGQHIAVRMSSSGTPVSTSSYITQRLYAQGTTLGGQNTGVITNAYISSVAGSTPNFTVSEIMTPFSSDITRFISQTIYSDGNNSYIDLFFATHTTVASYDGIYVFPIAGTLTGGTIKVYGYK